MGAAASQTGFHVRVENLGDSYYQVNKPEGQEASGYTLVIDERVYDFLVYGSVGLGVVVGLTNAPLTFVASVLGGYILKDMLQAFNDAVSDVVSGAHCSDNTCKTQTVLVSLATAAGIYLFPFGGLTLTAFAGVYGQALGSKAREHVEKSLPVEQGGNVSVPVVVESA